MRTAAILSTLFFAACAALDTPSVRITQSTFEDSYYPCAKVVFPETILYDGVSRYNLDNETLVIYKVKIPAMPQHSVQIIKRHVDKSFADWARIPLLEQYEEGEQVYERSEEDISYAEKGAVLRFVSVEGDIKLRAVTGIFPRADTGLMVVTERTIQKGYLRIFSLEKWKSSSRGIAMTEDMKKWTDWFYEHTELASCAAASGADEWWK